MMEIAITETQARSYPPKATRQRKAPRSLSERAEARRLATMWTIWLRDSGMSLRAIGRELHVGNAVLLYVEGRTAPLPATMARLRSACADRYPGGVDDERWRIGPEPSSGSEKPARAPLPIAPRDPEAPRTRSACAGMPRPCPAIACARNLLLDVNHKGLPVVDGKTYQAGVTRGSNHGWQEVEEAVFRALAEAAEQARATCADDIAERGGLTRAEVAQELGLTRERIRQIEQGALAKLRASSLAEHAE